VRDEEDDNSALSLEEGWARGKGKGVGLTWAAGAELGCSVEKRKEGKMGHRVGLG
jgi:hypothetical protein